MKFKKTDRLLTQSDFAAVFDASHRRSNRGGGILKSGPYLIYCAKSGNARLGLSIARRVIKNASDRNRIKRCVKEFFRLNKFAIEGDLIVRLSKDPEAYDYKTLTDPLLLLTTKKSL
jgi:ribonuclease P protein component